MLQQIGTLCDTVESVGINHQRIRGHIYKILHCPNSVIMSAYAWTKRHDIIFMLWRYVRDYDIMLVGMKHRLGH